MRLLRLLLKFNVAAAFAVTIAAAPPVAAAPAAVAASPVSDLERQVRSKLAGAAGRQVEYRAPDGFFGMAVTVPKQVEQQMRLKKSWRDGCPVPISELSYLVLGYWGFDGKTHLGELVLHRKLALETVKVFGELYALRFPIDKMELIERYDGDDERSMAANNTSAFNCRYVSARPGVFSNHSYGTAIDINPVQNPYMVPESDALKALGWSGAEAKARFLERLGYPHIGTVEAFCAKEPAKCRVSPPSGRRYLDRGSSAAGLIVEGPVVDAFTSRGFEWGGLWRNEVDYQHMQVKPARLR